MHKSGWIGLALVLGSAGAWAVEVGLVTALPTLARPEAVEQNYAELRQQAAANDRNPELYLLASISSCASSTSSKASSSS